MSRNVSHYMLLLAWLRAIFCIYSVASVSWRLAFCPEFTLNIASFTGFVIIDLAATIFFSYDVITLARRKIISSRQVLPETVDLVKGHRNEIDLDDSEMYEDFKADDSWWKFAILLLSAFPFEYASLFLAKDQEWPNYLMTNRLLQLLHLPRHLNELSAFLARRGYIKNIGFRRTWLLFFTMALAGHLCGSLFYMIGRRHAMNGVKMTWPEEAGVYIIETTSDGTQLKMIQSKAEAYISSLYWAYITMITTGFGDIVSYSCTIAPTLTNISCLFMLFRCHCNLTKQYGASSPCLSECSLLR
jgi:hypothetical protein